MRNLGMKYSFGKYTIFLDSDDMSEPNMIEQLYLSISRYHAEIAVCEYDTNMSTGSFHFTEKIKRRYMGIYSQRVFQLRDLGLDGLTIWGIYLDLDVFLIKKPDLLLKHDFFVGFDHYRGIEAAVFGAIQNCPVLKEMMEIYKNKSFDPDTGTNLLNLQPIYLDRFFEGKGFQINGRYQEKDGIAIYFIQKKFFRQEIFLRWKMIYKRKQ